jgi:hypothetical protein
MVYYIPVIKEYRNWSVNIKYLVIFSLVSRNSRSGNWVGGLTTPCFTSVFFLYRQYSVDYKLETYLKIARLYLENDDPVQAEAYINRASLLQVSYFRKIVLKYL